MLSEKKTVGALKPWWDIAYSYSLLALIGIGILFLLATSGYKGRYHKLALITDGDVGDIEGVGPWTKSKFSAIMMDAASSASAYSAFRERAENLTQQLIKLHGVQRHDENADLERPPSSSTQNRQQALRVKRSISSLQNESFISQSDYLKEAPPDDDDMESYEGVYTIYKLTLYTCLYLLEAAYSRVFYTNHLMQSVVHLMGTLSDVRQFKRLNHGLIFANTLHHAYNRSSLWTLFWLHNIARLMVTILALVMVVHFHVVDQNSYDDRIVDQTGFSLAILSALILIGQVGILCYATAWPWLVSKSSWGQLMIKYAESLDKIDVARGRCVPVPSSYVHSSRFSLGMFSSSSIDSVKSGRFLRKKQVGKRTSDKTSAERLVDALNPYTSSPNIRLILDMVAYRAGVGVALRSLAFLELDVHNNWRPFRPALNFVTASTPGRNNFVSCLEVSWRDPLAVLYLTPVPKELQLYYGIEITFGDGKKRGGMYHKDQDQEDQEGDRDQLVEIVGYDETRYFRHVLQYHSGARGSSSSMASQNSACVVMKTQTSTTADSVTAAAAADDGFVYREAFTDVSQTDSPISVAIWTIVDGQLIAKSTVKYPSVKDVSYQQFQSTPNIVPKPPRRNLQRQETVCSCPCPVDLDCSVADSDSDSSCNDVVEVNIVDEKMTTKESNKTSSPLPKPTRILLASKQESQEKTEVPNNSNNNMEESWEYVKRGSVLVDTPSDSSVSLATATPGESSKQLIMADVQHHKDPSIIQRALVTSKTRSLTNLKYDDQAVISTEERRQHHMSGGVSSHGTSVIIDTPSHGILRKAKSTGTTLVHHNDGSLSFVAFQSKKSKGKKNGKSALSGVGKWRLMESGQLNKGFCDDSDVGEEEDNDDDDDDYLSMDCNRKVKDDSTEYII